MLLFVATFDMAHETVRSEALSDKLRSAARRLPPGLLDPGEACAQKAARGHSKTPTLAAHRRRGSAADATSEGGRKPRTAGQTHFPKKSGSRLAQAKGAHRRQFIESFFAEGVDDLS